MIKRVPYKTPGWRAWYVGCLDGFHVWIGSPYWGGIGFMRNGEGVNCHLQDLLLCTGHSWKVRLRWFRWSWYVLLFGGWKRMLGSTDHRS